MTREEKLKKIFEDKPETTLKEILEKNPELLRTNVHRSFTPPPKPELSPYFKC